MDSCSVLVMLIVSYVYPIQVLGDDFHHNKVKALLVSTYNKTYLVDLEDNEKSDLNIGAGSDANDYGQDYQNGSCNGNLEFGWAYPSKKDDNNDLNWGATDKKNSPEECQAHCKKTPRCEGFTWVDGLNNCWIKHNMAARFKDNRGPGFISGRKDTCIGPAPWPIASCGNKKQCGDKTPPSSGGTDARSQMPDPLGIRNSTGDPKAEPQPPPSNSEPTNNNQCRPKDSRGSVCAGRDDCCTTRNQCFIGEGDCDTDNECKPGLMCGLDNCRNRPGFPMASVNGWDKLDDCCVPFNASAPRTDPEEGRSDPEDASAPRTDPEEGRSDPNAACSGDDTCCSPTNLCDVGEGDCDTDFDCKPELMCGLDNCRNRPGFPMASATGWDRLDDCCAPFNASAPRTDPEEGRQSPNAVCSGRDDCCTPTNMCDVGEGDCDTDFDCKPKLMCGLDNCRNRPGFPMASASGWDRLDDCCVPFNASAPRTDPEEGRPPPDTDSEASFGGLCGSATTPIVPTPDVTVEVTPATPGDGEVTPAAPDGEHASTEEASGEVTSIAPGDEYVPTEKVSGEVTPVAPGDGEVTFATPTDGEVTPTDQEGGYTSNEEVSGEVTPAAPGDALTEEVSGEVTPVAPDDGEVTPAALGDASTEEVFGEVTTVAPGDGEVTPTDQEGGYTSNEEVSGEVTTVAGGDGSIPTEEVSGEVTPAAPGDVLTEEVSGEVIPTAPGDALTEEVSGEVTPVAPDDGEVTPAALGDASTVEVFGKVTTVAAGDGEVRPTDQEGGYTSNEEVSGEVTPVAAGDGYVPTEEVSGEVTPAAPGDVLTEEVSGEVTHATPGDASAEEVSGEITHTPNRWSTRRK